MASSTIAMPSNAPIQIAQSAAAGLPSEISKSPLLGILGVIIGAGVVTLTGRMISLGLADLRGGLGFGFDDGSWISSAYNIALMFIGPFTVYLGALLGARRILLIAAGSLKSTSCLSLAATALAASTGKRELRATPTAAACAFALSQATRVSGLCCSATSTNSEASSEKFVGNWQASALRLSEEAVEFATSGVEGALLLLRAVVDQRAAVLVDHVAEKSVSRHFP
jgi:MFS family permease